MRRSLGRAGAASGAWRRSGPVEAGAPDEQDAQRPAAGYIALNYAR
jgi:hypothetical protein